MTAEPYRTWVERWEKTIEAVRRVGGRADELSIGPPATEAEIVATERAIGRRLPPSFRQVLLEFSGSVSVYWTLPGPGGVAESIGRSLEEQLLGRPIDPLRHVPTGEVSLRLGMVQFAERGRRERSATLRRWRRRRRTSSISDESLARWDRSVAFWWQDDSAVALDTDDAAAVVLLDRYGSDADSSTWLAPDFMEFMDRWTRIGGVQAHYLDQFIQEPWGGLDPECDLARVWRDALHVHL